jgi:hypothetical protein
MSNGLCSYSFKCVFKVEVYRVQAAAIHGAGMPLLV